VIGGNSNLMDISAISAVKSIRPVITNFDDFNGLENLK
jgi:hypothetical protein